MDFLGFTLGVWASIALGVFFLLMVLACTEDRRNREGFKWAVFFVGLVVFVVWQWGESSWSMFSAASFWKGVGLYLGAGAIYSMFEFYFSVRRAAKEWSERWETFKINEKNHPSFSSASAQPGSTREQRFMSQYGRSSRDGLVNVEITDDVLVPIVNRSELAQSIGCWMLFWPAYGVSLLLGDVLSSLFRHAAAVLERLSRGLVARAFAGVFR